MKRKWLLLNIVVGVIWLGFVMLFIACPRESTEEQALALAYDLFPGVALEDAGNDILNRPQLVGTDSARSLAEVHNQFRQLIKAKGYRTVDDVAPGEMTSENFYSTVLANSGTKLCVSASNNDGDVTVLVRAVRRRNTFFGVVLP